MSANNPLTDLIPFVEQSAIVHDGFVKIRRDMLRLSNDHSYNYYTIIARASAVVILALTKEGSLVLIEEYRHPTGKILLSCAGGYLENEHEDPCEAAKRELTEETGFSAEKYIMMGSAYPYPGLSNQKLYYVLAHQASKTADTNKEPSELIRTVIMDRTQLKNAIAEGMPIDGNMCTALFFESLQSKYTS